ncbi:MerR family transcriptional regulator [Tianweitania sediminis]|uniref:MerR family transcriptional regulator n=1 Tax=Tianweitania sediminis TaxID=1502156 RepID=A0A8J7UK57_9HYPH|nr:MerR family transcriptional regulator [Tianweitania sediminis]MBP0439545.1 MerR family transcriptional regulator [Tianweitania sediminis]
MPHDAARAVPGTFPMPAWWRDHAFTLREIAEFLGAPKATVDHWFDIARAAGIGVGQKKGGRRFYSAHEVFAACLLGKLREHSIPVSNTTISSAFAFACHPDGKPRTIADNAMWRLYGENGAAVEVEAWLCWSAARAYAAQHFD